MTPEQAVEFYTSARGVAQALERSHESHRLFDVDNEFSLPAEDLEGLADAASIALDFADSVNPSLRRP